MLKGAGNIFSIIAEKTFRNPAFSSWLYGFLSPIDQNERYGPYRASVISFIRSCLDIAKSVFIPLFEHSHVIRFNDRSEDIALEPPRPKRQSNSIRVLHKLNRLALDKAKQRYNFLLQFSVKNRSEQNECAMAPRCKPTSIRSITFLFRATAKQQRS